jgi:DNA-binding MarR family transcriptional regulator
MTESRQAITLGLLRRAGIDGLTWRDLSEQTGWHHGTASGALSVLHKDGQIARLSERRDKCQIYVSRENVLGRPTSDHQPNVSARILREVLTEVEQDLLADRRWDAIRRIRATLEMYDG